MRPSHRLLALLLPLALAGTVGGSRVAAAEDVPWDWVAQCFGSAPRTLTLRGLGLSMVQASRYEMTEKGSQPLTTLRQMTEEWVVEQVARTLGIVVTPADLDAQYREIDARVRTKTNGKETLRDVIAKEHSSLPEFRQSLAHLLRKKRIAAHQKNLGPSLLQQPEERQLAQIQVVVTELMKTATIVYGIATALQDSPWDLGPGVVATVNGEPITTEQFGIELARRLPLDDVRRVIDQECKSVLTEAMALSEQDMVATIEVERANWNKWREMSSQEAWRSVSFDDYVKARYRVTLDDLKRNRYFRGRYGLEKTFQDKVSPEEVRKEYEEKKDGLYGESIRAIDIRIGFIQKNQLIQAEGARERKDALRSANELMVQKESGAPFDQIVRSVNARQDRSFNATGRRLRNTDDDRILYDRAKAMRDGEVVVVETLSAVHVLRRESGEKAPTFDQVKDVIKDGLVRKRAEAWLDERMRDPAVVKLRWPLPEDVWAKVLRPR